MTRARAAALACVMSAACLGCAGTPDDERTAATRIAIIDGEPSAANEAGVLLIRSLLADGREVICSASLVGANLLVTARHCVSYLQEGLFACSVRGELINSADGAGRLGLHIPAEMLEVYAGDPPRSEPIAHGLQVLSTLSETICSNDLAFVVLDTELPLPLVPMRLGRPARFGETSVLVGYGLQRDQATLDHEAQPRLRKTGLVVAGVGPDSLEDGVTTVAPRGLLVEGPSGCLGDSGGPLLDEATGALLGVYSLQQGGSCSSDDVRHHLVHVPPFERLIADAFAAAGGEPTPEPEPSAGAGGSGGASGSATDGEGGEGGAGSEPEPAARGPSDRKASGCAFGQERQRAPGFFAAILLGALLRRRFSAGRRAGRRLSVVGKERLEGVRSGPPRRAAARRGAALGSGRA